MKSQVSAHNQQASESQQPSSVPTSDDRAALDKELIARAQTELLQLLARVIATRVAGPAKRN